MYCAQICLYLDDGFVDKDETSSGDYIDYIKPFYVKKLILMDVHIRSVFQNPVTNLIYLFYY